MSPLIHTIDLMYLGIPRAIAAFVVIGPQGPVLIETGPASTLDQLIAGLDSLGLRPKDIRHALVTHIHLDHAGAAGRLAQNGTMIHVHEFGAKHLVDPSKLVDSATRIYGEQMDRLWGRMAPVPAACVSAVRGGDVIEVEGLRFTAIETPGHARHHHAYSIDDVCFAGDAAGIIVPGVPEPPRGRFITVPTPPPEFDLEAWLASIDRLQELRFRAIHLTHFGERRDPHAHFARLREVIPQHAAFVRKELDAGRPRQEILERYVAWNREEAATDGVDDLDFSRYVSRNLLTMNVDGILRYWKVASGA